MLVAGLFEFDGFAGAVSLVAEQVTAGLLGGEQRFEFGDAGFQAGENVSHTRGRHGGHYEGGAGGVAGVR
ncbi:hypothetical protein KBZ21_37755, partial [Streptomyces sp. A73]|nr:hypothetical protein [Streptomyces sp. A73]